MSACRNLFSVTTVWLGFPMIITGAMTGSILVLGMGSADALTAMAIAVAAGNVWAYFIQWLSLLGILVPPIGAIILVDQYVTRPKAEIDTDWRLDAFLAWITGSAAAFAIEFYASQLSTAVSAGIVAGIAYFVISKARHPVPKPV